MVEIKVKELIYKEEPSKMIEMNKMYEEVVEFQKAIQENDKINGIEEYLDMIQVGYKQLKQIGVKDWEIEAGVKIHWDKLERRNWKFKDEKHEKLKMSNLINCFEEAKKSGAKYIAIKYNTGADKLYTGISQKQHYESMLDNLKEFFNDDLTAKSPDSNAKIVGFTYADSFEDIESDLYN